MKKISLTIVFIFIFLFIFKSISTMTSIPFHDFDEANRAEAARNMKIYHSYFNPLTGSPFKLGNKVQIPAKKNKLLNVTYHLERPPLYFLSMIVSTSIFKESEVFYRLPSFIFGLLTIFVFMFFSGNLIALLPFVISYDWWLSSQSALMDTTLSFFLFLAFVFILKFSDKKNSKLLFFSGLSLGAAILTKGQPAFIFIFLLIFLLFTKKINLKEFSIVLISACLITSPWVVFSIYKFGAQNFLGSFLGFAQSKALIQDSTQKAPFYWYVRWWIESFRLGWALFISLIIYDLMKKNFTYKKFLIIFYFFSSFLIFSLSKNKVWWYVLPLIPVCCLYIAESIKNILKKNEDKLINLSLIIFFVSIPVFYKTSNIVSIFYGVFLIIFSIFILNQKIKIKKIFANMFFPFALIFSLLLFLINFPVINPTYPETKIIGGYYQKLPQPKCLYLEDMPYEAALFYSQAEEVEYISTNTSFKKDCHNYLLTPKQKNLFLIKTFNRLKLYKLDTLPQSSLKTPTAGNNHVCQRRK